MCACVAGAVVVGCSGSDMPLVRVRGVVTFDGGPCPALGNITFTPTDVTEGLPRRPGRAEFDEDGKFVVSSFGKGDGLLPGKYRVNISCYSGLPDLTRPDPFAEITYIAPGFEPPELVIERGMKPVDLAYDVPKKK